MIKQQSLQKQSKAPRKAVAPDKGAAAFSISTAFQAVHGLETFPGISRHGPKENGAAGNLLPEKNYFRRGRAEGPIANVVLTEGQEKPLLRRREVAA